MERAFSLSVSVPTPFRIPHRVLALIGVITFILACCLAGCTSNAADSDSSATDGNATGEKTLRVAMELAYPPFETKDDAGNPEGLAVDFIRDFGAAYGYDVQIENTAWDGLIPSLQSDKADLVISSMTITDERKKSWDFTTPYYTDYVSVLVEDSNGIKDLADLKDKVVGVSSGSTSARALVKAMIDAGVLDGANFDADTFNADTWKEGISFRQYDDYPAISTALSANEIQGFCVDKSILAIYKTDGRSYVDAEFSPQEYGIATKKGSDFSALCDELVQGWLADGTVESLIKENGLS